MRKVTASAVILTALTGCSQSSIPSTQWSFKVPSETEVTEAQQEGQANTAQSGPIENSLDDSQILAEARLAVGRSSRSENGRIMGPAFEQPETDGFINSKARTNISTANSYNNSDLSARETDSPTSGFSFPRPPARPDPVAEVREYLRTNSPTALTSRAPYNSQVYLSSVPLLKQDYNLSGSVTESTLNYGNDLGENFSKATSTPITEPIDLSLTGSSIDNRPNNTFNEGQFAQDYSALVLPNISAGVDTSSFFESSLDDNALPQLAPTVPTNNDSTLVNARSAGISLQPVPSSDATAEDIPIGTAILNNLQSSSNLEMAADETVPAPAMREATVVAPVVAPAVVASSTDGLATPSISRLSQTMPEREMSPLVASYRAGRKMPQLSDSGTLVGPSPEAESGVPASSVPTSPEEPSQSFNPPALSPSSPLLEGLRSNKALESSSQMTVYVPIAETMPSDTSATLVKDAVNKVSTEVSTLDFIDEIAQEDVFSSVLSSAALLNSQPAKAGLPAANSVDSAAADESASGAIAFDIFDKLSAADSEVHRAKARRAELTLATSHQKNTNRHRLSWL